MEGCEVPPITLSREKGTNNHFPFHVLVHGTVLNLRVEHFLNVLIY